MLSPLVRNAFRAAFWPLLNLRRSSLVPPGSWVSLHLEGVVTEIERPISRWLHPREILLRGGPPKPRTSIADLRVLARAVIEDRDVTGVLLRVEDLRCGWATVDSLRALVKQIRDGGKRVVAWLPDGATNREYYLALACEQIYSTPQASISPLGVAAGMTFVRGLLARGGLEAEVFARKEYKSAAEMFTRDGYSDANRKQTEAILDQVHGALVKALSEGRKMDAQLARAMIEIGPFRAVDAVRDNLLDGVAYEDELPLRLGGKDVKLVPAGSYLNLARAMRFDPLSASRRVGVVQVRGVIVSQSRGAMGEVADAPRVVGALRSARANPSVGAVVLHVDSSGGSALASDVIAREVERLREKKPVVACFSDVAASGGYYVAAPATEIIAQPLTVTGSIGVIALRLMALGALHKLSMQHEVIRRGDRADLMSPYRVLNEGDRAAIDREIDGFYDDFVAIVARGRKKPAEEIEPLARGRVWAGGDAHGVGLVDAIGGLDLAVNRARELSGEPLHEDPIVVAPPRGHIDPPEPPAAVQAVLQMLTGQLHGARAELDMLSLALHAPHEHLFALADVSLP